MVRRDTAEKAAGLGSKTRVRALAFVVVGPRGDHYAGMIRAQGQGLVERLAAHMPVKLSSADLGSHQFTYYETCGVFPRPGYGEQHLAHGMFHAIGTDALRVEALDGEACIVG